MSNTPLMHMFGFIHPCANSSPATSVALAKSKLHNTSAHELMLWSCDLSHVSTALLTSFPCLCLQTYDEPGEVLGIALGSRQGITSMISPHIIPLCTACLTLVPWNRGRTAGILAQRRGGLPSHMQPGCCLSWRGMRSCMPSWSAQALLKPLLTEARSWCVLHPAPAPAPAPVPGPAPRLHTGCTQASPAAVVRLHPQSRCTCHCYMSPVCLGAQACWGVWGGEMGRVQSNE